MISISFAISYEESEAVGVVVMMRLQQRVIIILHRHRCFMESSCMKIIVTFQTKRCVIDNPFIAFYKCYKVKSIFYLLQLLHEFYL